MGTRRYAVVRGYNITTERVADYLPSNYRAVWSGNTDWHKSGVSGEWKQYPDIVDKVVLIDGHDDHGWTLDKYVIPLPRRGMMRCDEIDLSHEVMKTIPMEGGA